MRKAERVVIYTVLGAATFGAGWATLSGAAGRAFASPTRLEPAAARIASCDMFDLVDRLLRSDRFEPARKTEEDRIRTGLEPMQTEMNALRAELTGADMSTPENTAKAKTFQEKAQAAQAAEQKAQVEYTGFIAKQFNEAYELARKTAGSVGERLGFTYVLSSRGPDKKIEATDPQQLVQEFLSRGVVSAPAGSDITAEVAKELALPELPAVVPAAPAGDGLTTPSEPAPKPADGQTPADGASAPTPTTPKP